MTEAIELNLPLNEPGKRPVEPLIQPIFDQQKDSEKTDTPKQYRINSYYKNDDLGTKVLQQKYLAPWESHPWDLWVRQSRALASIEKTKTLRAKWEKKIYSVLENFKFVPGGRLRS